MMSQKILITGGAGYLGSIMVPTMLNRGFQVTVVDKFMFRQMSLLDCCANPNLEIVRGDARDEKLMGKLIKDKDIIIPLAALVGAPLCDRDPEAAKSTNLGAVEWLAKNTSKNQILIYPTTNSGYGIGEKGKFCTEETPLNPISLYGVTKSDAEKVVLDRGNSLTFRLATVFGSAPRPRMDLLVNDFVFRAVNDRTVVMFEAHFKRNYIHVRDVAKAFIHAIDNFDKMKGKPYNVGLEDANLSKMELCEEIKKQIPSFVFMEAPIGEDPDKRDYIVSNKRILSTGYTPDWTLAMGIKELIKAYQILKKDQYSNV